MNIIQIIVTILIIGFVWWLIDVVPSIEPTFKMIAKGILVLFLVLWILQQFGLFAGFGDIRLGR